ncbi:dnaJ homolog subfamily C member 5-like isoform X2 [Convolutriloba macropyga]
MRETDNLTGGPNARDRKMSAEGESLYKLLNIEKTATQDDIKRSYRKMALKYHPDKNRDNPEAAEMFKEINRAHGVLSDEAKKDIYDKYGSRGLQLLDQMGPDALKVWMKMNSPLAKVCFCLCFCFTGCCFCFCCFCCCCFCCGKCKPAEDETDGVNVDDFMFPEEGEKAAEKDKSSQGAEENDTPITSQPS